MPVQAFSVMMAVIVAFRQAPRERKKYRLPKSCFWRSSSLFARRISPPSPGASQATVPMMDMALGTQPP